VTCCEDFAKAVADEEITVDPAGFNVHGCCGGCYVLVDLKFCPWCGAAVEMTKGETTTGTGEGGDPSS